MKKIVLSVFVIVSFLLYSFGLRNSDSPLLVSPKSSSAGQGGGTSGSTSAAGGSSGAAGRGSQTRGTAYRDGTYTGPVEDAYYGNIQVQAIIQGGRITQVRFLQYPNDRPNSVAINQQAIPYLQQEAIQAQSAQVNGVSGATDTSIAFTQSLSSALRQAM
jgi:uncharacterized protein with FMN-binding domain